MKIKIKKLSACENPDYPTAEREKYKCGELPNEEVSLFVDYESVGHVDPFPKVGECLLMFRIERNGLKAGGILRTSPITKIEGDTFQTANSIYKWEEVK